MNLETYHTLFFVVTLGLALFAAYPALCMVVPFQSSSEQFSELWLFGSGHAAENYPFNVSAGDVYTVFVCLGNRMNRSEYYLIRVNFRNTTLSFLNVNSSEPSSLLSPYEFRVFVDDGAVWESPVTFSFQNLSIDNDTLSLGDITINGTVFPFDAFMSWDPENSGFYFQLFFELWRYDIPLNTFSFTNQTVRLWLNMTNSQ